MVIVVGRFRNTVGRWTIRLGVITALVGCADTDVTQGDWLPLPTGEVSRVAFGSCAKQWEPQPIWDSVVASRPDVFLFLGDIIYGDWDGEKVVEVTAEILRAEWAELAAVPQFQNLKAAVPVLATWDNHDYGHHSAGAEFPLREASQTIFLDFFGEPANSERRRTPGIYDAWILGPVGRRVQIILLDTRSFKGPPRLAKRSEGSRGSLGKYAPNADPAVTLLGEGQWAWLENQLRVPAEVRLIVSSGQVVADEKGMDEWGNYPHERRRLFDLIAETVATGVILLSGNVHFAEISRIDEGAYPLYDFTSSGLTHVNQTYPEAPNRYRVAGPYVDLNFGLVEIDWNAQPAAEIALKIVGTDGRDAFVLVLSLADLRPGHNTEG